MMKKGISPYLAAILATSVLTGFHSSVNAQSVKGGADDSAEIIVTARKRDETSISVPVVLTAVGGPELRRRGIVSLDSVAQIVPGLIIGEGGATIQGGELNIRGIGGADTNVLGDQAVSFNIDGVQIARSSVRRMAQMDIQQIEVLKGPQALFYGKNSPGGIITIRTADPTDQLEARIMGGYEFVGREIRGEGHVSGPLTETLGARLAFYGSHLGGWLKNDTPRNSIFAPSRVRDGRTKEYAGRLTLKYEPSDQLDARFKLSYSKARGDSASASIQLVDCPRGPPQTGVVDSCRADSHTTNGDPGPNFKTADRRFAVANFHRQHQVLGSLELNYHPTDEMTLTSVTGYYKVKADGQGNFTQSYFSGTYLASRLNFEARELSQELRVQSDYDGPVNFTLGGFAQDIKGSNFTLVYFNASNPVPTAIYFFKQNTKAYSAFGQLRWDILKQLELSGGGRYSYEKKTLPVHQTGRPEAQAAVPIEKVSFNDFSPEVTLSYRPSATLTMFGSYKRGFLSGGFNTGAPPPAATASPNSLKYNQETVKGFETGVKALLLDGALRTNLSVYTYRIDGMQLSVTVNNTIVELRNAGSARTKGIEFDFNYRTPLPGLSITGAVGYTRARYIQYIASCYRGQPSPACAPRLNPTSGLTALSQDLGGAQMVRAPDWSGNVGFNLEQPVGAGLKIGVNGNMSFSSSFFTDASNNPGGRTPSYQLFDAAVRVGDADDQWEVSLIGRNLTNHYYWTRSSTTPFTGSNPGLDPAATIAADTSATVNRGREVMLRFSYRFGG